MKGATAEDSESTIRAPSRRSMITTGVSHHFFRVLRKSNNVERLEPTPMGPFS
jgi:hypothetical protein